MSFLFLERVLYQNKGFLFETLEFHQCAVTSSMASSLLWKDLSLEYTELLLTQIRRKDFSDQVASFFKLHQGDYEYSERNVILTDLYSNSIKFCSKQGLSAEKTSCFISILKNTHEKCMEGFLTLDQGFELFKGLLIRHSLQRPPYSVGVMNMVDVKNMTNYAIDTYFRHYRLYKYAFTKKHELNFTTHGHFNEEPEAFVPLAEAMTEEEWNAKIEAERLEAERIEKERIEKERAEAEAQRKREELENLPPNVKKVINTSITDEIGTLRGDMEQIKDEKVAALLERLAQLEAKVEGK